MGASLLNVVGEAVKLGPIPIALRFLILTIEQTCQSNLFDD